MRKQVPMIGVLIIILIILITLLSVNAMNPSFIVSDNLIRQHRLFPYYSYETSDCIEHREGENISFEVDGNNLSYYHYSFHTN